MLKSYDDAFFIQISVKFKRSHSLMITKRHQIGWREIFFQ